MILLFSVRRNLKRFSLISLDKVFFKAMILDLLLLHFEAILLHEKVNERPKWAQDLVPALMPDGAA